MSLDLEVRKASLKEALENALSKLPADTRTRIAALIDLNDLETSGVVVAMHLAAFDYMSQLQETDRHMEKLDETIGGVVGVYDKMHEAINDLTVQSEKLAKDSLLAVQGVNDAAKASMETVLRSFGGGLTKTLPSALGSVLNTSVDAAVSEALKNHFQPFALKTGLVVIGIAAVALLVGVGIGALVFSH